MGLGYQALLQDIGIDARLRVWTDSSAAIGIASRQGLGKLRHLDAHTLWLQQAVRSGRIDLKKVAGTSNPADLFTKHSLSRDKLRELVALFGCEFREGRAATAPTLRTDQGSKATMADYDDQDDVGDVCGVNEAGQDEEDTNGPTILPHLVLSGDALDIQYPSLVAPDEVDSREAEPYEPTLEVGLREAERIAESMRRFGRTRKDFTAKRG
jgi:hypothetical protein